MIEQVPKCDICHRAKEATNGWFIIFKPAVKGLGSPRFAVYDWTMKRALTKGAKHICSQGCLSTYISKDMVDHRPGVPKRGELVASIVDEGVREEVAA